MPNAADCPITDFCRRLKRTKALSGVEVLVGATSLPRQTGAGRIVIWPHDGEWKEPSDKSIALADIDQQVIAECWGRGSPTTSSPDEQALQDLNVTWMLLQQLARAMEEQGSNPGSSPNDPGYFWKTVGVVGWNGSQDTSSDGTSVKVLFTAIVPVLAASDDTGHVGDNWFSGVATGVAITESAP